MAKTRTVRAFSAGGVVFRLPESAAPTPTAAADRDPLDGVEIALVGRARVDVWVLPKGTPQRGERVPETALREVREETGLITRIVDELGSIHYSFSRGGTRFRKEVFHFLLEATGGDVSLHDAEYDEARWFPARAAADRLTFENDAAMVRQALPLIVQVRAGHSRETSRETSRAGAPGLAQPRAPQRAADGAAR
ncbi:MAG TPA: NUDIX hydrolase [Ktedonobacterales bacterium]|jgi:8-oxo-dGTP pyrophosphatase MutT (NUDIX family)